MHILSAGHSNCYAPGPHILPCAVSMAEESADTVVSLQDVLEENQQLEETANAVLGPSDDSSCTYSKGYVDRQALYACATCARAIRKEKEVRGGERETHLAGVCLACSLHCHEDHDLYELYTKRNFQCDCGNSKFPDMSCALCPEKDHLNSQNSYNHNFRGLYCTCNRPYPDPEDEVDDEMIQCCVCEDWFHSRHLGGGAPPDGYEEMICDGCMASHVFLKPYKMCPPVRVEGELGEGGGKQLEEVDVTNIQNSADQASTKVGSRPHGERSSVDQSTTETGADGVPQSCDQSHDQQAPCELVRRRALALSDSSDGAGYFASMWRAQLCRCSPCMSLYTKAKCLFLLDSTDTIASYEARATSQPSTHESAMTAFSSSLDRVHQVEALHQYNDMKTDLVEFLQKFARDGKVVSKGDVEEFFEGMQAKKRRRLDTGDGVPPANCHF